jgi:hypothetical protein
MSQIGISQQAVIRLPAVHTSNRVAADVKGSPPKDFSLWSESAQNGALDNCTGKKRGI